MESRAQRSQRLRAALTAIRRRQVTHTLRAKRGRVRLTDAERKQRQAARDRAWAARNGEKRFSNRLAAMARDPDRVFWHAPLLDDLRSHELDPLSALIAREEGWFE